jgi:hypothetical protein
MKEEAKAFIFVFEMCFRMCSAAFPQVQHSPTCDYKYMYTIQCGGKRGVLGCVGDHIQIYKIAKPPQDKTLGGRVASNKQTAAAKSFYRLLLRIRDFRFFIAFYESHLSMQELF